MYTHEEIVAAKADLLRSAIRAVEALTDRGSSVVLVVLSIRGGDGSVCDLVIDPACVCLEMLADQPSIPLSVLPRRPVAV